MTLHQAKYKDLKTAWDILTNIYFSVLGIDVEQNSIQNEKAGRSLRVLVLPQIFQLCLYVTVPVIHV